MSDFNIYLWYSICIFVIIVIIYFGFCWNFFIIRIIVLERVIMLIFLKWFLIIFLIILMKDIMFMMVSLI